MIDRAKERYDKALEAGKFEHEHEKNYNLYILIGPQGILEQSSQS